MTLWDSSVLSWDLLVYMTYTLHKISSDLLVYVTCIIFMILWDMSSEVVVDQYHAALVALSHMKFGKPYLRSNVSKLLF